VKRKTDAALVALGEVWAAAERNERAAWHRRDAIEERVRGELREPRLLIFADQHCMTRANVLARCKPQNPDGPSLQEGERVWKEYAAEMAAYRARRRKLGLRPVDADIKKYRATWARALGTLARTPAQSVIGLAVKLRVIRDDFRDGEMIYSDRMLRSAVRDAERLAGKAVRS